ncbi:MAG: 4-alpha-glucanotransferase [Sandaracinus sp.]
MRILDRRRAGVMVPLFSLRSGEGWGVGELRDLPRFAAWAQRGGLSCVLTLPLLEPSPGQDSPYASCSFFALDPLYLAIDALEDFAGRGSLTAEERALLEDVEGAPRVSHDKVRRLKLGVLARCHAAFEQKVDAASARRADLTRFEEEHAHWLPSYALFRTLKAHHTGSWRDWAPALRDAQPAAIAEARAKHAHEVRFRTYLQWLAFRQLEAARRETNALGVGLIGDEPFLVADDAADVWSSQAQYRTDATVGAPPDAFSAEGQEWGLPPYRWEAMKANGYALFRARGAHTAKLYDAIRIDHVVGLYRTYLRPRDKTVKHRFDPEGQPAQLAQGEAVLAALGASGTELIAEDLGVIPDFVRLSLEKLGIPGHRVLRWEQEAGRYREPRTWPELSLATNGTHDTETSADWWEALGEWERAAFTALDGMKHLAKKEYERWEDPVWAALIWKTISAPSRLAVFPIQDVLSLRARINTPNTMGPQNWSFRLPWTLPALEADAIVGARMKLVRELAQKHGRA